MAEESINVEESQDSTATNNPEAEARAKGWKPKDEYSGDPGKWVEAEEFNKRTDLYQELSSIKKALRRRDKEMDAVVRYSKEQTELAYRRGVADLQSQLDAAVDRGDKQGVREITKEMGQMKAPEPDHPAEVVDFQERNQWFDKDPEMTDYAIARSRRIAENNPSWSLERRLEEVEKDVKKRFPENFQHDRRDLPSQVEGGRAASTQRSASGAKKYSVGKLNDDEKLVYKQYVERNKIMTHDEYFKSLEQVGREF